MSKPYFDSVATTTTLVYVNRERFGEMPSLAPPLKEQNDILQYLELETARIDEAIDNVRSQIEKLEKYRTVLISDAVTGKIDVRGFND